MFEYDGYIIETTPDYKEALKNGIEIEELVCKVYSASDTELKNCLNEFNMMRSFEYKEDTANEIENGIKNIIDSDCSYLELKLKQEKFERQSTLFYRAIDFIKQSMGSEDVETTLKLCIGMTDDEIKETLDSLQEMDENQEEGIKMS